MLLLTGTHRSGSSRLLAALNGASSAFFFPASTGIIPQTVTTPLLQQANAILRLALNATNITGAAIGGILVALTSPGTAIAIDAVSYFAAAACIAAMRITAAERIPGSTVFHELREGWHDFWSRTWLWVIVLQFGIVNAVESGAVQVLGPGIAKERPRRRRGVGRGPDRIVGRPRPLRAHDAALAAATDPARQPPSPSSRSRSR